MMTTALAGCGSLPWNARQSSYSGNAAVNSGKMARHKPAAPGVQPDVAPVPDPAGMSRSQVVALLGPPDTRAQTSPSEGWTYQAGSCIVRLNFFLDVTRNDYYALGRSVSGVKDDGEAQRCLRRIASRARPN